ncbi:sirohydrochlorin chelatase [Actinomycetospora termitidis]|uniref:CbiX/SirB N-terminal domain-containing protein n=1 Tax=Actinomycetospora termitidis TaxID=3053470 RepID=A0ABT7M9Z9_9PSEU|nr:CbiX/SirB N-terminal domain-containing protein [Actinomycetospora sp. Odt1-22]MDL5157286.1 CbiX/SirB N-terminal domain-containing protein [Actinomycetospora sp. Odt1-22]
MTLVVLAHGTNDPAGRATWGALLTRVRSLLPDVDVRLAWAGVARPQLADLLPKVPDGPVVVVPAFLASGFHVRRDVPDQLAALGRDDVLVTEPLGPDAVLVDAALSRLRDAGWADERVVLAAAGSTDAVAQADLRVAASLARDRVGVEVPVGYVAGGDPRLADVVAAQDGPVALLTWLLAPGVFHRWATGAGAAVVAEPLGDHPAVASLVADRYRASVALAG